MIMKNKVSSSKNRIIALLLVLTMILAIIIPLFYKSFAAETNNSPAAASSISSSSKVIVNYYKIADSNTGKDIDELTKDSPAFDLTVGLLDPNAVAIEGFDSDTGYAVLESASFYGENTNTGTLRQSGNTNSDGPMKLTATFKNVKYNGKSNTLTLRVGYAIDGISKSELVSFLVSQIPIDEEEDTKKDPAPPPSPKVVIDECTYGGNTINTEQSFTLSFNYFNSSNAVKMENLKIEVSGGENFVINNNSNTFYIEELGPKGIKNQTVNFTALKSIKESSSYPITLKFSYEYVINKERKMGEDTTQIYIPVHKLVPPPRLTISDISCNPTEIEEEEESTVTIQIANKGESDVKNVSVAISGNFKSDSYVKEIGTIPAGKVASPTFTITTLPATTTTTAPVSNNANKKNAPPANDKAPPPDNNPNDKSSNNEKSAPIVDSKITGTVVITFEDDDGNQHNIDRSFGLNVNIENEDDDNGMMNIDQPLEDETSQQDVSDKSSKKISTPWLIAIISGGVVVLGGTTFLVIKKIKAKRSEFLDEDI